jgi:hypothetical protein
MGYGVGSGSSGGTVYKPEPIGGAGGGDFDFEEEKPALDPGKFTIDLTDPVGSIGESIGSGVKFASGLIGGPIGALGSVGPDAETASIGQLAEDIGIPGGIGDLQLPHVDLVGGDQERQAATISQIPGAIYEPVYQLQQTAKERIAEARSLDYLKGDTTGLPSDLQRRLDAGESVDVIADELMARGEAISSNPAAEFAGEIVLDPTNLLAPGAAAGVRAARGAYYAVKAADDLSKLGMGQRFAGAAYGAASHGLRAGGQHLMDSVLGPTTSGVLHAIGTKPYRSIMSGLGKINATHAEAFDEAFAVGAAQMPRAVIGNYLADEAAMLLRNKGAGAVDDLAADVSGVVERRLQTARQIDPRVIERKSEELLRRVAPTFDNVPADELAAVTARKLAAITGTSVEDAARVLGRVDRRTAQTVHLAYYGKAGDDLAKAKAAVKPFDLRGKNIDAERLTLVAPDTMTIERAAAVLDGSMPVVEAVERFGVLSNRFGGKPYADADVMAFVKKLHDEDALISTVKKPTSGAHALPKSLGAWRRAYADEGYELGFAPEDGWSVVTDADGVPVFADPFVHFVSEADPVTMRNPLGRFVDSLMRGTTQSTIVLESRQRFVDAITRRKLPISPNQARAIHKAVLEEAAERGVAPRGLVTETTTIGGERSGLIDAIFRRFVTDAEFRAVTEKVDPVYLVLEGLQGNFRTVGLTQYLTGGAKRAPGVGPMAATMAEKVYPAVRFSLNAMFQLQELIESKVWNALRGVTARAVDPEVAKVYGELAELPELRYLAESGYFLNLASGDAVRRYVGSNTTVGRALSRFANVQGRKAEARIRQVLAEHGEEFQAAVQKINPRAWQTMTEAYGTTDARVIADRFLAERFELTGDIGSAMAAFDAARSIGKSPVEETLWQAWRQTFEHASRQAFTTHFFRPERGWLERTLNHPYLGLYPLSYQAKVFGEFTRFLVKRPFGLRAPLVGLQALQRTQEATVAAIADDSEFRQWIEDHPDSLYLMFALIPADPTNLGAGAPAWARHISGDLKTGHKIDLGREAQDTAGYALGVVRGPVTIGEGLGEIGQDVFELLDRAARAWGEKPS